jgi:hypothetical protein
LLVSPLSQPFNVWVSQGSDLSFFHNYTHFLGGLCLLRNLTDFTFKTFWVWSLTTPCTASALVWAIIIYFHSLLPDLPVSIPSHYNLFSTQQYVWQWFFQNAKPDAVTSLLKFCREWFLNFTQG